MQCSLIKYGISQAKHQDLEAEMHIPAKIFRIMMFNAQRREAQTHHLGVRCHMPQSLSSVNSPVICPAFGFPRHGQRRHLLSGAKIVSEYIQTRTRIASIQRLVLYVNATWFTQNITLDIR